MLFCASSPKLPATFSRTISGVRYRTILIVHASAMHNVLMLKRVCMQVYTESTDGSYLDVKESALVWHYKDADPDFGRWQAKVRNSGNMGFPRHIMLKCRVETAICCVLCFCGVCWELCLHSALHTLQTEVSLVLSSCQLLLCIPAVHSSP